MKLTAFFIMICLVQVYADAFSQRVSLEKQQANIDDVIQSIEKQTGYHFIYDHRELERIEPLDISVHNVPLAQALDGIFKNTALAYKVFDNTIVLRKKPATRKKATQPLEVEGEVIDENGNRLPGVSVRVKGRSIATSTDEQGQFKLTIPSDNLILEFSFLGFRTQEVPASTSFIQVQLVLDPGNLDEVVVIGYGTTTQRLNTGSVSSVTSTTIANQPVSDPLAALQGRIPGLMISSNGGMPGASFNVQLRGANSMKSGNAPLFIIDGVPFASDPLNQFIGANGRQSPLNSINPNDIERIDVLKDADATAIYGSRGANGVILITTKKGKPGKTAVNFNLNTGWSQYTKTLDMLSTEQYLELRREAFENDGVTPTEDNAPDILLWNPDLNTDWQEKLIGHSAPTTDAQLSFSGGSERTRFLVSGSYRNQGNVMTGNMKYKRGATHLNVNHRSEDGKFTMNTSVNYSADNNNSIPTDLSQYYGQVPNYPVYDDNGDYYWFGTSMQNPMAYLERTYQSKTSNLLGNATLAYDFFENFTFKTSLGYTQRAMDQTQLLPEKAFNPATYPGSSALYGQSNAQTYIVEPQLNYTWIRGRNTLKFLLGGTWQQNINKGNYLNGTSYPSDEQLENMQAAGTLSIRNFDYSNYKYHSVFGRVNYSYADKYLANVNLRRDASSRFGPNRRFADFGSIGLGWIFSNENFVADHLPVLSFGKLRTSYGTTGNDQIGDYQYLDTWGAGFAYQGLSGLYPTRVFNPNYGWEENRKLEFALELGFLEDRLFLNTAYYNNRSGNQLVGITLSPQTGFDDYIANLDALVENSGWEFDLSSTNWNNDKFSWTTSFNLSIPKNVLLEYPGLEDSPDANSYVIGESIRIARGFDFIGVDPQTGLAQFRDIDGDDSIDEPNDFVTLGNIMPQFYGGLSNTFRYRDVELDIFFQFVKQEGPMINYGPMASPYGTLGNVDISALDRWRQPGDMTDIPRATSTSSNEAYSNFREYYRYSSAVWGDASYIRLKNVSLRYNLASLAPKIGLEQFSVFFQAQNLLTFTKYRGLDPEIQGFDRNFVSPVNPFGSVRTPSTPTLKTFTFGVQVSL